MSLPEQKFSFLVEEYRACHARINRLENDRTKTQQFAIAALSALYVWVFFRAEIESPSNMGLAVVPLIILVIFYQQSRGLIWLRRNRGYLIVIEAEIYSGENGEAIQALGLERFGDTKRNEEVAKVKALEVFRSILQNPRIPFYTTVGDITLWGTLFLISLVVAFIS